MSVLTLWLFRTSIILSNVVFSRHIRENYYGNDMLEAEGDPRMDAMMDKLADYVCTGIFQNGSAEYKTCRNNFLGAPLEKNSTFGVSVDSSSEAFAFHCRGLDSITVKSMSDDDLQLAVLMEEDNETNSIIDTAEDDFNRQKALVKGGEYITFEELDNRVWYQVWSVPLGYDGRRLASWKKSVMMQSIRGSRTQKEPTLVTDITKPSSFVYLEDSGKKGLSAQFLWERPEDGSCYYTFTYICDLTQPEDPIDIGPEDPLNVTAYWLPFNTSCQITIDNVYSNYSTETRNPARFTIHTPTCHDIRGTDKCPPMRPVIVSTQAKPSGYLTKEGALQYNVVVNWNRPEYLPDTYNVTLQDVLRLSFTWTTVVDGNATEAYFEAVPVAEEYAVTVTARNRVGRATSRVAHGHASPDVESRWIREAAWAAACGIAGLILMVVLCMWRRARMKHQMERDKYFKELEKKAPKEISFDSGVSGFSFSEDVFELGSDKVQLYEVLGEGAFGVVRKGRLLDQDGEEVAVKMLKDFPSLEDVQQFRQEMEMMKSVGEHPHVVCLLGCITTPERMMIVVEYCARGDLLNYLRCAWDIMASKRHYKLFDKEPTDKFTPNRKEREVNNNPRLVVNKLYDLQGICETELTAIDLISFCRQIAMGMEFLASNRVVHRDLAARNVLVCADKTVKIADFGLSRDVYQNNQYKKVGSGKLPVKWMALESLTHQLYTTQSDVWSFGIVMWEAVTLGGAPYPGISTEKLPRLLRSGFRMPRPHNCSTEIYEVMASCWRQRPKDRPTFTALHQQLDTLLNGMCHKEYLNLDLMDCKDIEDTHKLPPDKLSKYKYWMKINRDRKSQSQATVRLNIYQKYMKAFNPIWRSQNTLPNLNHYSVTPKHPTAQSAEIHNLTQLLA